MHRSDARTLTRYNAWANELLFAAVAALPEGEALKPRRSVFRNMVHTLNHNYVIDRIFQAHLEGRGHGYTARNTPDHPPLAELWHAQRELDHWYVAPAAPREPHDLPPRIRRADDLRRSGASADHRFDCLSKRRGAEVRLTQ